MVEYVNTKKACSLYQVTPNTLRRWDKEGKIDTIRTPSNIRLYSTKIYENCISNLESTNNKRKICYCRVSSRNQRNDLERQISFMQTKFPEHTIIQDIGSGINWKRTGLKTILESAMQGKLSEVVVTHRDRLCRFAFELVKWILEEQGVKLMVLNEETQSDEQELAEDLLSIIHVFSCRKMGQRRYKKEKNTGNKESKISSFSRTTEDVKAMDRPQ